MRPFNTWQDKNGDWFFEAYDSEAMVWTNHGPFNDEEQAEYAAMRFLQHE